MQKMDHDSLMPFNIIEKLDLRLKKIPIVSQIQKIIYYYAIILKKEMTKKFQMD